MIYFIEAVGADLVKIGFTERDIDDRLRELQTASPHPLRVALALRGDLKGEAALHEQFAHLRAQGEWFRYEDDLRFFVGTFRCAEVLVGPLRSELAAIGETLDDLRAQVLTIRQGEDLPHRDLEHRIDNQRDRLHRAAAILLTGEDDPDAIREAYWEEDTPVEITDATRRRVLEEFRTVDEMSGFLAGPRGR